MSVKRPSSRLIEVILEEISDRRARGDDVQVEEYVRRHPELRDDILALENLLVVFRDDASRAEGRVRSAGVAAPEQLGDFQLMRRIGRGGMGVVYLARQLSLRRNVALKLISPPFGDDPGRRRRFRREAASAARLEHPGIVRVYASGEEGGVLYIAMELVGDGRTLESWISDATALSDEGREEHVRQAAQMAAEVAEALHHAHAMGVMHRDVKPSNVLLEPGGRARLSDFGLAKLTDQETMTASGATPGTPRYMSPEQVSGSTDTVDHRTDIYSLGVTLYEALTLQPPITATSPLQLARTILDCTVLPPSRVMRGLPASLEAIVLKAMEKDPRRRYQRAEQLARDLRAFLCGDPVSARPPGFARRIEERVRKHATIATVIAIIAIVAVGITWSERIAGAREQMERNLRGIQQHLDDTEPSTRVKDASLLRDHLEQSGDGELRLDLLSTLADINGLLGDWEAAEAGYAEVFTLAPTSSLGREAYFKVAQHAFRQGATLRARSALDRLLGLPELPPGLRGEAQVMRAQLLLPAITSPGRSLLERDNLEREARTLLEDLLESTSDEVGKRLQAARDEAVFVASRLGALRVSPIDLQFDLEQTGDLVRLIPIQTGSDGREALLLVFHRALKRLSWESMLVSDVSVELTDGLIIVQAATGDFDGDGEADVALAVQPASREEPYATTVLLLHQRDGVLTRWHTSEMHWSTGELAAGDMDGDGMDELVVCDQDDERRSHVLDWNGDSFDAIAFRDDELLTRAGRRLDLRGPLFVPAPDGRRGEELLVSLRTHGRVYPRLGAYRLEGEHIRRTDTDAGAVHDEPPLLAEGLFLVHLRGKPESMVIGCSAVRESASAAPGLEVPPYGVFMVPFDELREHRRWPELIRRPKARVALLPGLTLSQPHLLDLDETGSPELVFTMNRPKQGARGGDANAAHWIGVAWDCETPSTSRLTTSPFFSRIFEVDEQPVIAPIRRADGRGSIVAYLPNPDPHEALLWSIDLEP